MQTGRSVVYAKNGGAAASQPLALFMPKMAELLQASLWP
jgi:hypothetical protein